MEIFNADLAKHALEPGGVTVKFLLGRHAVFFFPASQQHRDVKAHGLSYEDDYQGNALAGILSSSRTEVRYHSHYPDALVHALWSQVQAQQCFLGVHWNSLWYQGRLL